MGGALALEPQRIHPAAWLLIFLRVLLMLALLFVCLPFYYLWRLLRLPRLWPRIFLAGVGIISGVRITIRGKHHPNALLRSHRQPAPPLSDMTGSPRRPFSNTFVR
jgi:hypothetical protein